jgi:hypothetical protein
VSPLTSPQHEYITSFAESGAGSADRSHSASKLYGHFGVQSQKDDIHVQQLESERSRLKSTIPALETQRNDAQAQARNLERQLQLAKAQVLLSPASISYIEGLTAVCSWTTLNNGLPFSNDFYPDSPRASANRRVAQLPAKTRLPAAHVQLKALIGLSLMQFI